MNIAYIPVRGGSKSIPMKNIKLMMGRPLVYWVVKAACECADIDAVYVSSDSEVIRDEVSSFGFSKLEVIDRSTESATDKATTEVGMLEFASRNMFENIVLVQATSPLLTATDLTKGFAALKDADSVLSVVNQKRFIWEKETAGFAIPVNYDVQHRPRRQEFEGYLVENGAFYITSRCALMCSKSRVSGKIRVVEMPSESYIEIDEPEDWEIVEAILSRRVVAADVVRIKMFLTDCDGTLTDGGMYYDSDGERMKKFNTRDGVGLRMLRERGIVTGIITGEESESVLRRAEKVGVDELLMGIDNKVIAIETLCDKYGIDKDSVAYIGDDLNDVAAICCVGLGMSVSDAASDAKESAKYVTKAGGGKGAVREAADYILKNERLLT